ncbi:L,D-transpeptidase [Sphingomonas koreensis]|nr:L,D-transpeptidase [Sphingomonas koreensis]
MAAAALLIVGTAGIAGGVALSGSPTPKAAAVSHPGRLAEPTKRLEPAIAAAPAPQPDPAAYVVKHILTVDGPMRQGDYYWNETGAPEGQRVITIDLAAGTISIFRAGYEIGTAVIIAGDDEKPTPLGIFPITQKDADHHSTIYDGAPMPYMLRLTNDGISIHGSEVGDGYVTHGCIGVPVAFARKLFGAVKLGDRVIITRGEMLDLGDAITAA